MTISGYNRLIRDKIPEIIEAEANIAVIQTMSDEQYIKALNTKLKEELEEYYEESSVEELADLIEVVYAILGYKGVSLEEFDKRLFLRKVI